MSIQDQNPEHGLDARKAFAEINQIPEGAFEVAATRRGVNRRAVSSLERGVFSMVPELRVPASNEVQRHAAEQGTSPYTYEADPAALRALDTEIESEERRHEAMGAEARADIAAMPNTTPSLEAAPDQPPTAPPSEVATQVEYISQLADDRYNSQRAA